MKTAYRIIIVLIVALVSLMGHAQVTAISGQAIDQNGVPLPGAQVRVCSVTSTGTPCSPLTPIYYDFGLGLQAPNPYAADQYGNYSFYVPSIAAPNLYMIQLVPAAGVTWSYIQSGPGIGTTGGTVSGPITANLFNATVSPYFEVNGTQIACANLSDCGSLANIHSPNVFTITQTATIFNATVELDVGGTRISSGSLSDGSNIPKLNSNNFFPNTQSSTVFNSTIGFQIGTTAPANHVLLGNGSAYVDAATIPYSVISGGPSATPFGGAGIPYAYSTTASNIATADQLVNALNNAPTLTLTSSLFPLVGTAGTYTNPTSIATDQYGRVTAVGVGGGGTGRTCNLFGCYKIDSDGTITQWGVASGCSGTTCTVGVTFPTGFTTTSNLSIQTSCSGQANCLSVVTGPSAGGFVITYTALVEVGGPGGNLTGSQQGMWQAKGN